MYLYILARWINVWRPVRMSVRPFFLGLSDSFRRLNPWNNSRRLGPCSRQDVQHVPINGGLDARTQYIYILYTLYMYILDGPGWIESQCDRHIGHTQNDITLMFTVSERSMSLQQGIHSAWLMPTSIILRDCRKLASSVDVNHDQLDCYVPPYVHTYTHMYIYIWYIYIWYIYDIYDKYIYDIYDKYIYIWYIYVWYIYTYNNNYRYYRYIISINPDPSARVPKKPGDHQPGRGGSSHVVAGERRRTRRWQRRSHRGDRSGLAETGETGDFNGGPTLPSDKLT